MGARPTDFSASPAHLPREWRLGHWRAHAPAGGRDGARFPVAPAPGASASPGPADGRPGHWAPRLSNGPEAGVPEEEQAALSQ